MLKSLRDLKRLIHDAVELSVDMVELGHESAARTTLRVLRTLAPQELPLSAIDDVRRLITRGTLGSVRAVNRLVERLTDLGLDAAVALALLPAVEVPAQPIPLRSDVLGTRAWLADAALGALNGVIGDHLQRTHNSLDLGFLLRLGDSYHSLATSADGASASVLDPAPAAVPALTQSWPASRRVALFVHGLATTEWSWCWDASAYHGDPALHFGALLQRDLGIAPVFARYNTGRHIAENGRLLADGLAHLFATLPENARPDELVLIGHSMGGLVARSACDHAHRSGHDWVRRVSRVICLGSPHQGAPLAKLGHALTQVLLAIDHPGTRIPGELLRRRSAGIKDLRHGTIVDPSWLRSPASADASAQGEVPALASISYHFLSATVTKDMDHPLGWLVGDVLVRPPSAAGPPRDEAPFPIDTACFPGVVHHQLQNHPDVYAWLRRTCADRPIRE